MNWKVPETVKEGKSFLGFVGYYRRFIPNVSHIAQSLLEITQINAKYPKTKFGDK